MKTNPYAAFNKRAKSKTVPQMPVGDAEPLVKALYVALQEDSPAEYLLPIVWYLKEKENS